MFHGVIAGDMPLMGLGTVPKNIPVAANRMETEHKYRIKKKEKVKNK